MKASEVLPSREQLKKARETIAQQLIVLRNPCTPVGPLGGPPDNRALIAVFEEQLREIEDALAEPDFSSA